MIRMPNRKAPSLLLLSTALRLSTSRNTVSPCAVICVPMFLTCRRMCDGRQSATSFFTRLAKNTDERLAQTKVKRSAARPLHLLGAVFRSVESIFSPHIGSGGFRPYRMSLCMSCSRRPFRVLRRPSGRKRGWHFSSIRPKKSALHERDLDIALRSNTTLSFDRLLSDVDYPSAAYRSTFYAQSLSLVDYMMTLNSPKEFVRFASLSTQHGPDHALSVVYDMDTRQLSDNWRAHAARNGRQQ
jgi:hypothetical protein